MLCVHINVRQKGKRFSGRLEYECLNTETVFFFFLFMVEEGQGELEFYLMSEKRSEKGLLFMSEIERGRGEFAQNVLKNLSS